MKKYISISVALGAGLLLFATTYGFSGPKPRTQRITFWDASYSDFKNTLTIKHRIPHGSATCVVPWKFVNGHFDFAQDDNHFWAYDGDRGLLLFEVTPKRTTTYSLNTLPYSPPQSVLERLPDPVRLIAAAK